MIHEMENEPIDSPSDARLPGTLEIVQDEAPEEESEGLAGGLSAPRNTSHTPSMEQSVPKDAVASKYYTGQVIDPRTGQHLDGATGKPIATAEEGARSGSAPLPAHAILEWKEAREAFLSSVGKCLLAFAGVLAVTATIAHFQPGAYIPLVFIACFVGGVLLPVTRAAPWADEDSDDILWLIILTIVFGPAVALLGYVVAGAVKQDVNPGVLGCLLVGALARFGIDWAAGGPTATQFMPWQVDHLNWKVIVLSWCPLVAMAGWYAACVFHKLDE